MNSKESSAAEAINMASTDDARTTLLRCCAAESWANELLLHLPFASDNELLMRSEKAFAKLNRDDWMQAFSAHPKIGDVNSLRNKYADTLEMASGEQSGVADANEETILSLASANDEYFNRFGYIFIICATGKTASQMLDALRSRLNNDPDDELTNAAAEQVKITAIRLKKIGRIES